MTTLIPHGTTPTGFGVRQRRNGKLRPTSPCCGRSIDRDSAGRLPCRGCATDYTETSHKLGVSVSNDVPLSMNHEVVQNWLRHLTGFPHLVMQVNP